MTKNASRRLSFYKQGRRVAGETWLLVEPHREREIGVREDKGLNRYV